MAITYDRTNQIITVTDSGDAIMGPFEIVGVLATHTTGGAAYGGVLDGRGVFFILFAVNGGTGPASVYTPMNIKVAGLDHALAWITPGTVLMYYLKKEKPARRVCRR